MFRPPAFGAHFLSPPDFILGSEQVPKALKSNRSPTQFWRRSADAANTTGIMLAGVYCELLLETNLTPPATALLLCGVGGVGEAFFRIQPKICQPHISRVAFEPYALPVASHLEGKRPSTAPAESDLDGLVQADEGTVAAHQEPPPDMGTGLTEHDA